MDKLNLAGISLVAFGATFSLLSYSLIYNIPLTALGLGALILGFSLLITPTSPIPHKITRSIIEGSALSLEMLLEELNVSTRGVYVPGEDKRVYLCVPLSERYEPPGGKINPRGMVTRIEGNEYLTLIPPVSEIPKVNEYTTVEDAITDLLVNVTELCESAKVAHEDAIYVEIKKPRVYLGAKRFEKVFGSLEASVAACAAAAILNKPITVFSEHEEKNRKVIVLKVHSS